MKLSTLPEWLAYIASIHSKSMDLGLERVKVVAEKLDLTRANCPVIIVGGTNGKGSTVAGLEAIYLAQGYQTGCFTTPYLYQHNEQVRINHQNAKDELFCDAFTQVEAARGNISLTQFEFNTLAALLIFKKHALDVWIVEVGLGGRLDAVNILDADVAIVTSISIDHKEWLGDTREAIGREKAGIFRPGIPAIIGDPEPPVTLVAYAKEIGAHLYLQGHDFFYQANDDWEWHTSHRTLTHLPRNTLLLQNMSAVLMTIHVMQNKLPVSDANIKKGLKNLSLPGRMQIEPGAVMQIFDVAHNQASVELLAQSLRERPCKGKTHAVFSMLADKEIEICLKQMLAIVDQWHVGELKYERRASVTQLKAAFANTGISNVTWYPHVKDAYQEALSIAERGDRIVVFGSFHTLAEIK